MQKTVTLKIDKEKNILSITLLNGHEYKVDLKKHNIDTDFSRNQFFDVIAKAMDKRIQQYLDMAGLRYVDK